MRSDFIGGEPVRTGSAQSGKPGTPLPNVGPMVAGGGAGDCPNADDAAARSTSIATTKPPIADKDLL